MYTSKLIMLLNSFSAKEMKSFTSFLSSPYHNTNQEIVRFFNCLKPYHPFKAENNIQKIWIFNKMYPSSEYNDKLIRYLMSDLLKLAESFLLLERIEKNKIEAATQLIDEFKNRNLDKHYKQLKIKVNHYFARKQVINLDDFLAEIKISDIEEKYFQKKQQRQIDGDVQNNSDNLSRFFVLKKLRYACSMLSQQMFLKKKYALGLPENWMSWIKENSYWNNKTIEIYSIVFLVLKYPDDSIYFDKLLSLLDANTENIPKVYLKEIFLSAINYCVQKTREDKHHFVEKALELYTKGIKTGALLENGYFSHRSFNNVVKLALRLEKFDWIENFMEENKHFLSPSVAKNTLRYNLAELSCYKKDFSKALSLLSKVEFVDLSYQLGSRIMLSKIYYEQKEEKALLSLISSFMMFLKRHEQISDPIRKSCLNFCDLLFLLVRGKVYNIEEKINTTHLLTDRTWLLEKIAEIKTR